MINEEYSRRQRADSHDLCDDEHLAKRPASGDRSSSSSSSSGGTGGFMYQPQTSWASQMQPSWTSEMHSPDQYTFPASYGQASNEYFQNPMTSNVPSNFFWNWQDNAIQNTSRHMRVAGTNNYGPKLDEKPPQLTGYAGGDIYRSAVYGEHHFGGMALPGTGPEVPPSIWSVG